MANKWWEKRRAEGREAQLILNSHYVPGTERYIHSFIQSTIHSFNQASYLPYKGRTYYLRFTNQKAEACSSLLKLTELVSTRTKHEPKFVFLTAQLQCLSKQRENIKTYRLGKNDEQGHRRRKKLTFVERHPRISFCILMPFIRKCICFSWDMIIITSILRLRKLRFRWGKYQAKQLLCSKTQI